MKTSLTEKESLFLDALFNDANGNFRAAMDSAGYSKAEYPARIIKRLKDEIIERAEYVLAANANQQLTLASKTLKNNLKSYINEYRMIGDTISIKNAFIINFAIDFEIITYPNYNNNEVLQRCIVALSNYFNIDKWQINQPIITPDLSVLLDAIDGVQTVKQINFTNKAGINSGYSQWAYDMNGANQNGTIFPSLDPSIFELKYPNTDIKGRVVNLF